MIKLVNIKKLYGDKLILNNLNLEINEGEMIAIKGISGSGKTTLLNILGLIDTFQSGEYYFNDKNIKELNSKQINSLRIDNISFVFQSFLLIEYLTTIENILLPLKYQNKIYNTVETDELLKNLGILHLKNQKVNTLSGGEKQRVAIARAVITKPKLILADEPTGNLDEMNTDNVANILKMINKKYGITILVVTHNTRIENVFKKIYHLVDGQLYEY
ncbi:MAG TPA: ABC transporter ATP-binding protein [Gallicola sp.]|nr:ABC transporter ATP-binding protein [Gallicola sp.]